MTIDKPITTHNIAFRDPLSSFTSYHEPRMHPPTILPPPADLFQKSPEAVSAPRHGRADKIRKKYFSLRQKYALAAEGEHWGRNNAGSKCSQGD